MVFSPEATRQAIRPLVLTERVASDGPVADYCRYYHLDFEHDMPGVHHACGWVELAGYRILVHAYRPATARGTVWIVHGYLEHSGLYRHIIPLILKAGFAVIIHDLPGHGLSSGVRASIGNFQEYQHILDGLVTFCANRLPQPWLALGQSTGAAILMDYVLARPQASHFQRLFFLAPLVYPARMQWLQMKLAFWWFQAVRSGLPRAFRTNTGDADFVRFMRDEDPLQARWIPLSWLLALKDWIDHIHQARPCPMPVWIVQGERDGTVNGSYNVAFIGKHLYLQRLLWLSQASHQLANERSDIRAPIELMLRQFLEGQAQPDQNYQPCPDNQATGD